MISRAWIVYNNIIIIYIRHLRTAIYILPVFRTEGGKPGISQPWAQIIPYQALLTFAMYF